MQKIKDIQGTMKKLAIQFSYPSDNTVTLDTIDFYVEFFCEYSPSKVVKILKEKLTVDDSVTPSQYYAYVDTSVTGKGSIKMRMHAEIPDADAPDGLRVDYVETNTGIVIY